MISTETQNRYETLWSRVLAFCLDGIILAPAPIIGTWIVINHSNRAFVATCLASISAVVIAYWILSHGLYGQSFGKKLCGIVVLDKSESKLSMNQAILRISPAIASLFLYILVNIYLIQTGNTELSADHRTTMEDALKTTTRIFLFADFICMVATPKNRAVHDFIANSVVAYKEKLV